MASWATNRRFLYGGSVVAILAITFLFFFFRVFYHSPTCSDGIQNGDETGVDCGGSCRALCTSDALTPIALWSKLFNVSGDVYTVAAYVENPNVNSSNPQVQYEFKIFDSNNILIESRRGTTFMPRNKKFVIFEPGFTISNKSKKRVEFSFVSFGQWQKDTTSEPDLSVDYSPLLSTSTIPRITGSLTNKTLNDLPQVELTALVYDGNDNAVAVSRTFVDTLRTQSSQDIVFTWPKPFDLGVETCANPEDIALVLDRSSSMRSERANPPEPFSTVKTDAENFIQALTENDQAAVISFGSTAKEESPLSSKLSDGISAINALNLSSTTEETNIADGLQLALSDLINTQGREGSKKVIILLTDGVPTRPTSPGQADYPKISAEETARTLASQGITLYAIGLGSGVDEGFLKNIVGDTSHYYYAPTKDTLARIYGQIGAALCPKKPNRIEIISRIPQ